jgi:hypothetical protein
MLHPTIYRQGVNAMHPKFDQPVTTVVPEAAISALFCLFHQYVVHESGGRSCLRLSQRIFLHLEDMAGREDIPELLRRTCDDLSDAWLLVVDRQQSQRQARRP